MNEPLSITPLHRCRKCGGAACLTELHAGDKVIESWGLCSPCLSAAKDVLASVRPVFDAMIAAGVERGLANDTMTFLLDRME